MQRLCRVCPEEHRSDPVLLFAQTSMLRVGASDLQAMSHV